MDADIREVTLLGGGHRFRFRYDRDSAFEMICIIMAIADDADTALTWREASQITELITRQALTDGVIV